MATPTIYELGLGGSRADLPHPGADALIDLRKNLKDKTVQKYREIIRKELNLDPDTLPPLPRCDCSGYAWWIVNEARMDRNTDWIHRDATEDRTRFEVIDLSAPFKCQPGDFLVYAKPVEWHAPGQDAEGYGHIGLVTEVNAQGQASRVIHCSAKNHLVPPSSGALPSSIAETDAEVFVQHALYPAHPKWATLACRYIR